MSRESDGLDLRGLLRLLRRQWWVIAAFTVVVPVLAVAVALTEAKQYQASAALLFNQPPTQQSSSTAPTINEFDTDPDRVVATDAQLVALPTVARRTAAAIGHGMTPSRVTAEVAVSAGTGDTDAVTITATDHNPALATNLANTFGRQYIAFRKSGQVSTIKESEALIQGELSRLGPKDRDTPYARGLQSEASQLAIQAALQTGDAQLVQPATTPSSASSPRPKRDALFGLLAGLILGLAAGVLRSRLDQRIRSADAAAELFDRPLLAAVPFDRETAVESGQAHGWSVVSEACQMLRTNLRYFNVAGELRSVVVTSPYSGDGKSTIAWGLAAAAAHAGERVLLIETDLRHPSLKRYYEPNGTRPKAGLVGVLTASVPLSEALDRIALVDTPERGVSVDVLLAGGIPPNPIDLVGSDRMADVIKRSSAEYDLVVVDTPPTGVVPDATPIVSLVDGVIAVCRVDHTSAREALQLKTHLVNVRAPILGVVANCLRFPEGYGYYYGSAQERPKRRWWPGRVWNKRRQSSVPPVNRTPNVSNGALAATRTENGEPEGSDATERLAATVEHGGGRSEPAGRE